LSGSVSDSTEEFLSSAKDENGLVFLREFESFATLHHITSGENERKIAAFHLQLTGPALTNMVQNVK
jgi:hypothetical protein